MPPTRVLAHVHVDDDELLENVPIRIKARDHPPT
jgi:hypothetical protein